MWGFGLGSATGCQDSSEGRRERAGHGVVTRAEGENLSSFIFFFSVFLFSCPPPGLSAEDSGGLGLRTGENEREGTKEEQFIVKP